jgi:RNA polymerase sigma-70 factor (ECF subfamily)
VSPATSNAFVLDVEARYGRRLRRFLASRLVNPADAADLAQEVFLRLLRIERQDKIRNPEAYLLTIASHILHEHSLRQAALPESMDIMEAIVDADTTTESDAALQVHVQRNLESLDRALARLSLKARAAFVLHHRDGCTVDEIALRLELSRSMVKKHLANALLKCRQQIELIR